MGQTTRTIKLASELAEGDIVLEHGMRLLIDRPIRQYEDGALPVFNTRAQVLNIDEVEAADAWLARFVRADARDTDGDEVRWTVQSNDLHSWYVETAGANESLDA